MGKKKIMSGMSSSVLQDLTESHPHCLLAFSWVACWLRQLHYFVEGDDRMKDYDLFFSQIKAESEGQHAQDLLHSVNDFLDYFFIRSNIEHFLTGHFHELDSNYGQSESYRIPLCDLLIKLTDKERYIFRSLTLDVFYSSIHPTIFQELGRSWGSQEQMQLERYVHGESKTKA